MEEWLRSLIPWGTEILVRIQVISSSRLDPIWRVFTFLGYEEFYLVMLPFVYWCVHKRIGAALGFLAMISTWTSDAIKYVFNVPRPSDPRLRIPAPETSPSFLSGHTMSSTTNWGFLGVRFRNWAVRVVAGLLIVLISVSRMVLGVHFPEDLIGGFVVGLVLLAAYLYLQPRVSRWLAGRSLAVQLILAVTVPVALIFLHPAEPGVGYPSDSAVKTMSALAGLSIGLAMEKAWLHFGVDGSWLQRLLRLVLGLVLIVAVYAGPKLVLPSSLPYYTDLGITFVRYGLVGWTTAFLAPWVFVRLGLAGRETPAGQVQSAAESQIHADSNVYP